MPHDQTLTPEELAYGLELVERLNREPQCVHEFGEEKRRPHAIAEAHGRHAMDSWCRCGARQTRFVPIEEEKP